MALVEHVALVSETPKVSFAEVARVASAIQVQVSRDFEDIWKVRATVAAFESLDDVPVGHWPVIIRATVEGAEGIHLDDNGAPFALVTAGEEWSLTASHEVLEMLVDPMGNRMTAVEAKASSPVSGTVQYLVEVCDPSEDSAFSYSISGVKVSDFYTPQYFDAKKSNVRYSFTNAIQEPLEVLKGGYASFFDPVANQWYQETWFSGAQAVIAPINAFKPPTDRNTRWALKGADIRKGQRSILHRPYTPVLTGARKPDPAVPHRTVRAQKWSALADALIAATPTQP